LLCADVKSAAKHLETSVRCNATHRALRGGAIKASQTHVGQLLNEYLIESDALERLCRAVVSDDSILGLAELQRGFPDWSPVAISFLISLRRNGLLDRRKTSPMGKGGAIPRTITQYWDRNMPEDVDAICRSWREKHPDFSYKLFSEEEATQFLRDNGPPGAQLAFARAFEPAMKADLFRLAYLFHKGGYYVDADDRCLAPIPTIDPGYEDLLLYQEDYGTAGNDFIGAVPHHPVIEQALTQAITAINRGDKDMAWLSTGPALLTRCLASYIAEDLPARISSILILERHQLFEAVAIHCAAAYKHTKKHWSRTTFKRSVQISEISLPREPSPAA
jgi:mannosyltransferase OCH1-like enzyme